MPSTTISGRLLPVMDLMPRMVRLVPPVGPELFCWILRPGTSPYRAAGTVDGLVFVRSEGLTPLMAYGVPRFDCSTPRAAATGGGLFLVGPEGLPRWRGRGAPRFDGPPPRGVPPVAPSPTALGPDED